MLGLESSLGTITITIRFTCNWIKIKLDFNLILSKSNSIDKIKFNSKAW